MFERIRCMLVKEFIQIMRDPRLIGMIFLAPMIQLFIFGYAATTDVRRVPTAVYDLDETPASRELIARFAGSGYFDVTEHVSDPASVQSLLDRGEVACVLHVNRGFEGDLHAGRTARAQLLLDGTDSNTAGIVLSYASRIVAAYSGRVLAQRLERLNGVSVNLERLALKTRAWFNGNLESRLFYVPGVIANIVTLITLMLTSMAVVREKENGTMEQIMVTPITPAEFILGKTVPFAVIAFLDVIFITVAGVFWFDVPIRGSLALLFGATALYLLTALGLGLLISTLSETQQQAMMVGFFFFFPAMLLSGFMFPIANMPKLIQWITLFNPLRHFLVILRGIFLKGVGASILWPQMAALAALGVAMLWLATKRLRKTIS